MVEKKLKAIADTLEYFSNDTSIPRNIRRNLSEAKEKLTSKSTPLDLRIATAINIVGECAQDPNAPYHALSDFMKIQVELEEINKVITL